MSGGGEWQGQGGWLPPVPPPGGADPGGPPAGWPQDPASPGWPQGPPQPAWSPPPPDAWPPPDPPPYPFPVEQEHTAWWWQYAPGLAPPPASQSVPEDEPWSPTIVSVARVLRGAAAVGAATALVVIVTSVVIQGAVPHAWLLLIPGIPIQVVGHLASIVIMLIRQRGAYLRAGLDPNQFRWRPPREVRRAMNRGLSRPLRWSVAALMLLALSSVLIAPAFIPALDAPTPETVGRCEATLTSGGTKQCVDADDLERYQGFTQRFGATVLMMFFVMTASITHSVIREDEVFARSGAGLAPR